MTDPIKAKIIELVPEILDLRIGCRVMHPKWGVCTFLSFQEEKLYLKYGDEWFSECGFDSEGIEILGRPITLADVLRSILMQDMTREQIRELLHVQSHEATYLIAKTVSIWNLTTDYDGQTQEVKEFIGKLLNV